MRRLDVAVERWPVAGTFAIARGSRTEAVVVVVSLTQDGMTGRGESVPYARYGESVDNVLGLIESVRGAVEAGASRARLAQLLPAGAARNGLDCALWDLEARCSGVPLHVLAGTSAPGPMITAYTLSLGSPQAMGEAARAAAHRPLLKVKLGGAGDVERIAAVRAGAPDARLIVDANEAWNVDELLPHLRACEAAGVELIEQPLPEGRDGALADVATRILLCADESIHDAASLEGLPSWYGAINIKLDKTGGLTDALALRKAAQARGLEVMIGCMLSTSLSMMPALILAQEARYVDLDAPLLLARDREQGLRYQGSLILPPQA